MRIRIKKNREQRLAAVQDLLFEADILGGTNLRNFLLSQNPKAIYLEIGCGKGAFATELAQQNSQNIIIAVEQNIDVLIMAMEKAKSCKCDNIIFLNINASLLREVIGEGMIDKIYLNFSDPWPKVRHEKRRLTHSDFLNIYKTILKPGGHIVLKTDNTNFFDYSIESLQSNGFFIQTITRDLHSEKHNNLNIQTEYEVKFASKGVKIKSLEGYFLDLL